MNSKTQYFTWWTMDTVALWSTHTAIDWSTALQ